VRKAHIAHEAAKEPPGGEIREQRVVVVNDHIHIVDDQAVRRGERVLRRRSPLAQAPHEERLLSRSRGGHGEGVSIAA